MIRCVLLCPLVVSPWTFFQSLHVWHLASWVISSRDYLDVFRLGPGPEIAARGHHCHLPPPALLWAIWATAGQCSWLLPLGHTGLSHTGPAEPLTGPLPRTMPCQLSHPGSVRSRSFPQETYFKLETERSNMTKCFL